MLDNLLFIIIPYSAIVLAVVGIIWRLKKRFTISSLSSQFLEADELFYGSVAWHFGVLGALTGHFIGFLFPKQVLWFNGVPIRLYILESTALLFGLLALVGVASLIWRRAANARIRAVTSKTDVAVLLLLFVQVALGVHTALFYRWGSSWYATSAVPYLYSILTLQPNLQTIAPLPLTVKLHIVNASLFIALLPFSRLIHMLAVPVHYLWRPYQVVVWNRDRRSKHMQTPKPKTVDASLPATKETAPASQPVVTR